MFNLLHHLPGLAHGQAIALWHPSKDFVPPGLDRVRRKLEGFADGERQMISIVIAVSRDALPRSRQPASAAAAIS